MKLSISALLAAAVLLAGCNGERVSLVYKRGVADAKIKQDMNACEFAAVKEIPRAMAVSVTPGYSNPGTLSCSTFNGITNCQTIGAVNIPGSVSSYDANRETRKRFFEQCLANKGYSIHDKPVCRTEEEKAARNAAIKRNARAEEIPCGTVSMSM